ncbi:MAG: spermidine synthase [Phycisphaerae bacterium]|nr:spermidine synthase [Phycisphaerae bacterium]
MTRTTSIYAIFFLSGVAGLGYELIWTRAFAVGLGHEYPAALAVVAAFFSGLALGAALFDRVIARSRRPGAWYAGCELVIGLWAVLTATLIPASNALVGPWIGVEPSPLRHALVAFLVPFLVLLPATAAMGATLPAMERLLARLRGSPRVLAGLYAANTLGAAIGVLGSVFVLMPALGVRRSAFLFAGINGLCAVLTWLGPARGESVRDEPPPVGSGDAAARPRALLATLFLTGLLGVGYEVAMLRVLAQCFENTVFSFAAALAVYLIASAAGAALFESFAAGSPRAADRARAWLPLLLAVVCALQILFVPTLPAIHDNALARLGSGVLAAVSAETLSAAAALWFPALLMGALFAALAQSARGPRGGVGAALALNTLGCAMAPAAVGALAVPALGLRWTLAVVAAGYLLPAIGRRPLVAAIGGLCVIALTASAPPLDRLALPPGLVPIATREGIRSTALVASTADGENVLRVNRTFQMGSTGRGAFAELRQGHLPILLHPHPRSALFLGLGTAITFAAAGEYEDLQADGVELLPEVVALLDHFRPDNAAALDSSRLRVITADARRFVAAADRTYDVIVADLFHPALDGAASLYTVEHFAALRGRLAPGGLFAQWLPLHQLDPPTLDLILRSFRAAFGGGSCFLGVFNIETPALAIVAGGDGAPSWRAEAEFPTSRKLLFELGKVDLHSGPVSIWGAYCGELDQLLDPAAPTATLNSDDHPRVLFEAPAQAYRNVSGGPILIRHLLRRTRGESTAGAMVVTSRSAADARLPKSLSDGGAITEETRRRIAGYQAARDFFLDALLSQREHRPLEAGELLLRSIQASDDFAPAYLTLITVARESLPLDRAAVRRWLTEAAAARPNRNEAKRALEQLGK